MRKWKDEIIDAFKALGGIASYQDVYNQIERTTSRKLTKEWKATVRREIENRSSASENFRGGDDIFYPVDGIHARSGRWGLKNFSTLAIVPQRSEKPAAEHRSQVITPLSIDLQLEKSVTSDTDMQKDTIKDHVSRTTKKHSWLEDITTALENLGGIARYDDIYKEVQRIRTIPLPEHWEASIRGIIEDNSADSLRFKGKNAFFSVEGIGHGIWGLRKKISIPMANAIDFEEQAEPQRVKQDTYRILRDTFLSRTIKALYKNACQICGDSIDIKGNPYAEAHHIKPLGKPHNGPDVAANIIILCPNHHVMLDYGAIVLKMENLIIHPDHQIGFEFIQYYNQVIVNLS